MYCMLVGSAVNTGALSDDETGFFSAVHLLRFAWYKKRTTSYCSYCMIVYLYDTPAPMAVYFLFIPSSARTL